MFLFFTRTSWIFSQQFPSDFDSFYYLQEFRTRLVSGHGYYAHLSPYFFFMSTIGRLFHLTPVALYNFNVSFSMLLFTLCVFGLCATKKSWCYAAILLMYMLRSDILFLFFYGFLRQGFSVCLFALGILLLLCSSRPSIRLAALLSISLAAVMHLFTTVLAILFLIAAHWERSNRKQAFGFLAVLGLATIATVTLDDKNLGDGIGWSGLFPWNAVMKQGAISPSESFEYTFIFFASLILFIASIMGDKKVVLLYLATTLALLTPIWSIGPGGFGYRFMISAIIPFLLGSALFIRSKIDGREWAIFPMVIASAAMVICAELSLSPRKIGPGMDPRILEENSAILSRWLSHDALVLAPHGLEFRVTYFLNRAASHSPPLKPGARQIYILSQHHSRTTSCISIKELSSNLDASCVALPAITSEPWYFEQLTGPLTELNQPLDIWRIL